MRFPACPARGPRRARHGCATPERAGGNQASRSYPTQARALSKSCCQGEHSPLQAFLGRDFKGTISALLYASGIALSFAAPWAALVCYGVVTCIWLVPDRRIEKMVADN